MSKWLAITALLGATLVFTAPAHAQQGRRGRGAAQFSVMQLPPPIQEKLKLTDDQKTKLAGMRDSLRQAQMDAQNNGGNRQEIAQKANADALAVLTSDQKSTFDGLKATFDSYAGLGQRNQMALLLVDGISDDEKGKLKALGMDTQMKLMEARTSAAGDRQAFQQKSMEINTQATADLKKILTDDQNKQLDAALEKIPAGRRRGAAAA